MERMQYRVEGRSEDLKITAHAMTRFLVFCKFLPRDRGVEISSEPCVSLHPCTLDAQTKTFSNKSLLSWQVNWKGHTGNKFDNRASHAPDFKISKLIGMNQYTETRRASLFIKRSKRVLIEVKPNYEKITNHCRRAWGHCWAGKWSGTCRVLPTILS
jgi:hypothetical protein